MERQELLKKIRELIKKQRLPKEIKKMVDKVYKEYHNTHNELLSQIKQLVGDNKKAIADLNYIQNYINKEDEENKGTSYEVEEVSYFLKMEMLLADIEKRISNMLNGREERKEKEEEEEEKEEIDTENKKCTKMIVITIISEISSSKKALLMRLSNVKGLKDRSDIKQKIDEFSEKINNMLNTTKLELTPKIEQILETEEIEIRKAVFDLYHQYKKINEPNNKEKKEKFVASLHVEVKQQEAIERLPKEQEKEEEKSSEEDFTIS